MDKVSVILSTYNEEKNIVRILKSCIEQTYKNFEIIVVDSTRSTDKTALKSKKYTSQVFSYGKERSQQRNYGVKKASGKYLLIIDADMKLDPGLISSCVTISKKSGHCSVIIPEISYGEGYWSKCKALERNCYIGDHSIEAPRFFEKQLFEKAGGYNPNMISGEDWDLHRRLKKFAPVVRTNKFIYHYEGNLSLFNDLRKKYYYSQKSSEYISSNVSGIGDIISYLVRPAFIRNWKVLVSDPVHLVGLMIMKTLELSLGGFAIISQKTFWLKIFN